MNAHAERPSMRSAPPLSQFGQKGNLTKFRQTRALLVYGLLCILGLAPIWLEWSPGWQAAGIGLWLPGGGFLAVGGWWSVLLVPTFLLFGLSLIAWFGAGAILFPLAIWIGAAAIAGSLAVDSISSTSLIFVPVLTFLCFFLAYRRSSREFLAGIQRRDRRISFLPAAKKAVAERASPVPEPGSRELSIEQLQSVRYLLDRSLQPVDSFEGFDRIDQFQTASYRYQINGIGYALALLQCHYTPSFHGYLSLAQRNLIEKYLLKKVWGYWVYESVWGHFNFTNFDPAAKDNIMLTGWLSLQIGMYTNNTGDRRYAEVGSLPFRLNGRTTFPHDHHSLNRSVVENFKSSAFCLYPCEPNWIYPICNHYGITSIVMYDRVHGTDHAERLLDPFFSSLDSEFTDAKGTPIGLKSSLTGMELPFPSTELLFASFTNSIAPERAWQMWALARTELGALLKQDDHGNEVLRLPIGIDFGNYRRGAVGSYGYVIATAREFGDEAFALAAERGLLEIGGLEVRDGVRRYTKGSNLANIGVIHASFRGRDDYRKLVTEGPPEAVLEGPILTEARYPEVLVAKAYSDGANLDLVLYPGLKPGDQTIRIERLIPNRVYNFEVYESKRTVQADAEGALDLAVMLSGRTQIRVELCPEA